MPARVAINGFGRIGRLFLRASRIHEELEIVAINDLSDKGDLRYLLQRDSVHGPYPGTVEETEAGYRIDGGDMLFLSERSPVQLPWAELEVDVVVESTGAFRKREDAALHLEAGARKVVVSAPMKGEGADLTIVMGVNEGLYEPEIHHLISNASCTTNALAPVAKVLHEAFGIRRGFINTVHAYTSSQALVDVPMRKRRRGRAAALNMIPTTTGAAEAVGLVLPELSGKLTGLALRVPVPDGSIVDLTAELGRAVTADEVNEALEAATHKGRLGRVLGVSDEELVSSDIVGDARSGIVDLPSTMAMDNLVKVLIWYDNEFGYSNRLADCVAHVAQVSPA